MYALYLYTEMSFLSRASLKRRARGLTGPVTACSKISILCADELWKICFFLWGKLNCAIFADGIFMRIPQHPRALIESILCRFLPTLLESLTAGLYIYVYIPHISLMVDCKINCVPHHMQMYLYRFSLGEWFTLVRTYLNRGMFDSHV